MNEEEAGRFLIKTNADYVVFGKDEQALSKNKIPYQQLLTPVVLNNSASLYRVNSF